MNSWPDSALFPDYRALSAESGFTRASCCEEAFIRLFVDLPDTSEPPILKSTLKERFEQIDIYIASYPVDFL